MSGESLSEKVSSLIELTCAELKKECEKLGLPTTGKKEELVGRIKTAIEENEGKKEVACTENAARKAGKHDVTCHIHVILGLQATLVEKDKLIIEKDKRNDNLEDIITMQREKIKKLEGKLGKQKHCEGACAQGRAFKSHSNNKQTAVQKMVDLIESPYKRAPTQGQPNKNTSSNENVGHAVRDIGNRKDGSKQIQETEGESRKKSNEGKGSYGRKEKDRSKELGCLEEREIRNEKYRNLLSRMKKTTEEFADPQHEPRFQQGLVKIEGDSMIRGAGERCEREGCQVSVYPGIKINELTKQICRKQEEENEPEVLLIHVGTNNITKKRAKVHLVAEIDDLINTVRVKWGKTRWVVGGLVYRNNVFDSTIDKLNDGIKWLCEDKGAVFYDPNTRLNKNDTARDGIHLNHRGGCQLANLMMEKIEETINSQVEEEVRD